MKDLLPKLSSADLNAIYKELDPTNANKIYFVNFVKCLQPSCDSEVSQLV